MPLNTLISIIIGYVHSYGSAVVLKVRMPALLLYFQAASPIRAAVSPCDVSSAAAEEP